MSQQDVGRGELLLRRARVPLGFTFAAVFLLCARPSLLSLARSLVLVLPVSEKLVLSFGPPEFFLLSVLGLVMVATASRGKMLRGLISGGVGLMIAFVGFDQVTGTVRYTFG